MEGFHSCLNQQVSDNKEDKSTRYTKPNLVRHIQYSYTVKMSDLRLVSCGAMPWGHGACRESENLGVGQVETGLATEIEIQATEFPTEVPLALYVNSRG